MLSRPQTKSVGHRVWTPSKPFSDHFFSRKDNSKQDWMIKNGLFLIRVRVYTKQPLISDQNFLAVFVTSGPFCGLPHSGCIVVPWHVASLKRLPLKCTMKLNVNKTRTTERRGECHLQEVTARLCAIYRTWLSLRP